MSGKKRVMRITVSVLLIVVMILSIGALAHGGRTDSSGGHKDNKNKSGLGSYHYHCGGHPAHLHSGGVCPYSGSGSEKSATKKPSPTATPVPVKYVDGIAVPDWPDAFPIQKGSRGSVVKSMQKALIYMGYLNDAADGIFGVNTDAAVELYYADIYDSFFDYDGSVDEALYIAIMKSCEEIKELQDAA